MWRMPTTTPCVLLFGRDLRAGSVHLIWLLRPENHCAGADSFPVWGTLALVAANGDQLWGTVVGGGCAHGESGDTWFSETCAYTVNGGTGRFGTASGNLHVTVSISPTADYLGRGRPSSSGRAPSGTEPRATLNSRFEPGSPGPGSFVSAGASPRTRARGREAARASPAHRVLRVTPRAARAANSSVAFLPSRCRSVHALSDAGGGR